MTTTLSRAEIQFLLRPDTPVLVRRARKGYDCRAARPIDAWEVHRYCEHGVSIATFRVHPLVRPYIEERTGTPCHGGNVPAEERWEIVERPNRFYASDGSCAGGMPTGSMYVEDVSETPAWQSGDRFCVPCGLRLWGRP